MSKSYHDTMSVASNIDEQLCELEVLRSMFPAEGELVLDDPCSEADLREWAEKGAAGRPPATISYTLKIKPYLSEESIEVSFSFPHEYPGSEPAEVYLRSPKMSREQRSEVNARLGDFLKELEPGELLASHVVAWVQELDIASEEAANKETRSPKKEVKPKDSTFARFWLYSHHIYSKIKRRNILDLAPDFNLTGFCMPGKPGIVCLEGSLRDCTGKETADGELIISCLK